MKIDGYSLLCEFFNTRKDEKVLKSFPILSLSIYEGDKLKTRRYLTARFNITNKKLVIDRLSMINPLPIIVDKEEIIQSFLKILWKPMKAFDLPYKFLDSIEYDPETKSLKIETLKNKISIFMKFRDTKQTIKEIIKLVDKVNR